MKSTISAYEFLKRFPDEKTVRLHLEQRRWHGSPSCPHCGSVDRIQTRKIESYFRCLSCKNDFTVRTGTIFERSHVPLDKWLYAIYLLVASRKGISSMQLSKEIDVTQKTAWFMLQRLREACGSGSDGSGILSGVCEADEHAGYREMPEYGHKVVNHSAKQFVDGIVLHTNGIESVLSVIKQGFYGVYQQFSPKHLQRYVGEFAYRLNEDRSAIHTLDRIDSLLTKTQSVGLTYANLTGFAA